MSRTQPDDQATRIARALATAGGHLHIGRGGFTLHYENSRLSGYDCEPIKRASIAAGLPVIDSRTVRFELVAKLAVRGPMIAVNAPADPRPWHSLSYAPLAAVAAAYRCAGAEVFNIPESPEYDAILEAGPQGRPASVLIDFWFDHVRAHGA